LSALQQEVDCAEVTIEQLSWNSTGYIVPHAELMVRRQMPLRAQIVVGADGHHSTVRQRCGIDYEKFGEQIHFAAYEFVPEQAGPDELRVVMDTNSTNVLWPLPGGKLRWTFQMTSGYDFPEKERRVARVSSSDVDEEIRQYVEKTAHARAPWFKDGVKEITWCTRVSFEKRLARSFGTGQCWLAGDAAHQTGPAGAQSMNSGLLEAAALAPAIEAFINGNGSRALLEDYQKQSLGRWRMLLGLNALLRSTGQASPWVAQNLPRILPSLPALDNDLLQLAKQINLDPA
jgi:2-polyprenyl-6-methoxyphenol hydroxylase-like FAD-dependent oxidoreductase